MSLSAAIAGQVALIESLRELQATHRTNSRTVHETVKVAKATLVAAQEAEKTAEQEMNAARDAAAVLWMRAKAEVVTATSELKAAEIHAPVHSYAEDKVTSEYQAHIDAANAVIVHLGGNPV